MGILSYGYKAIKAIKPTKMSKGTKTIKEGQADVSKIVAKKSKENPRIKEQIKEEGIKTKAGMTKSLLKHNLREKKMGGGMMGRPMYKDGSLKPVDKKKNPGLSKLPTKVRNKMGYMKKGGQVK